MEVTYKRVRDDEVHYVPPVLKATREATIPTNTTQLIPTNISVVVPEGQVLLLMPIFSGIARHYSLVHMYEPGVVSEILVPVRAGRVSAFVDEGTPLAVAMLVPASTKFREVRGQLKAESKKAAE